MASSSTRTTAIELHLHSIYKFAIARLVAADRRDLASHTTEYFAMTLDVPEVALMSTLKPRLLPDYSNYQQYEKELSVQRELERSNRQLRRCEKIFAAGNAFADAAVALMGVGRAREAATFSGLARELGDIAAEAQAEEQYER